VLKGDASPPESEQTHMHFAKPSDARPQLEG
jgi:hypothetical protein